MRSSKRRARLPSRSSATQRGSLSESIAIAPRTGRRSPHVEAAKSAAEAQLALFAAGEEGELLPAAPTLLPLIAPPEPPLHRPRRLSFTALSTFEQCSYRYYARYVVGMPERRPVGTGDGGLRATEIGDAVHKLLEQVDLAAPSAPDLEQVRIWYPTVSDDELERIRAFVVAYCDSDLARRVAALDGAQKERHFTFEHDGVLLHGFVDVMHLDGTRALVVDYKTNLIGDSTPEEIVEGDYSLQRLVYALALLPGRRRGRRGRLPLPRALGRRRLDDVHARPGRGARRRSCPRESRAFMLGAFRPTPSDFACSGCPALDLVCAGPRLGPGVSDTQRVSDTALSRSAA